MALTATATSSTRKYVCQKLGMLNPTIVSEPPNKPNIKYVVEKNDRSVDELMTPLVEELRKERTSMPRVIIFCRTYNVCGEVYMFFKRSLGNEITEPVCAPNDLSHFRLVDMFTACTNQEVKDEILCNFSDPKGILRIVVATVAFGMGLDCPNVRRIIHIGAPSDVEAYLQETGRAGRDGNPSTATLYYCGTDFAFSSENNSMKEYCSTNKCRRQMLLKEFAEDIHIPTKSLCTCCDICACSCSCDLCLQ